MGALRLKARQGLQPGRRRLGAAVGHRLPDVRMGRGRAALRRPASSVHRAGGGRRSTTCAPTPRTAVSRGYDMVLNGNEIGGGSIRIHRPQMQSAVFDLLGIGAEEARGQVRLPAGRAEVRRAAARRHRLRHRPHRRADGRHRVDPRRDRVPEDHRRAVPDDRCAVADRRTRSWPKCTCRCGRRRERARSAAPRLPTPPCWRNWARRPSWRPSDISTRPKTCRRSSTKATASERMPGRWRTPRYALWIAEDATGRAIGYALAGPCGLPHADVRPEDGELKRLYVRAGIQNGGTGRALIDAAMAWLLRDGPRTLWIGGVVGEPRRAALLCALWLRLRRRIRIHRGCAARSRIHVSAPGAAVVRASPPCGLALAATGCPEPSR